MEEEIKILEELKIFCEDLYYFVDDDRGGHFKAVIGDQKANTMLGYLRFKKILENLIKENKECTFLEDGTEECLWMCSNCKDEWMFYDGTPEDNRLRYCPFCGAKVIKYKSYIEQETELAEDFSEYNG